MRAIDDREKELDEQIAALKRRKKELRAASGAAERKARTRGLILIGGIVVKQFTSNGQLKGFIKNLTTTMPEKERAVLATAFPDVFPAPAEPSSSQSQQETTHA